MNQLENYLDEYSKSHQNKWNILIHKICVPLIMFSLIGLIKAIPVPESWPLWLDWSTFLVTGVIIFYGSFKNVKVITLMSLFLLLQIFILEILRPHFFILCFFLFVMAWIFQFIGHRIERNKPSFFKDLLFLLIGPIWLFKKLL